MKGVTMKVVSNVPESITRADHVALIASVGFEVNGLRSLEFRLDGVYAEVYDRDEEGRIRLDVNRDEAIVNRVFIPVKD